LYIKKITKKNTNKIVLFRSLSPVKFSVKNAKYRLVKKQAEKRISNVMKLIGLDLFKKLASIDSFVIFAV
jgi:hypothetical protein